MSCEDEDIDAGSEYLGIHLSAEGVRRLFELSDDVDEAVRMVLQLRNEYLCLAIGGTDIQGCMERLQTIAESLRNAVKGG